jgi:DNA-directed RNA polymerase subunit RPC12/RpoP
MKVSRCPNCGTRVIFQTKEDRTFYIIKEKEEKEIATHYCVKCDIAFNS